MFEIMDCDRKELLVGLPYYYSVGDVVPIVFLLFRFGYDDAAARALLADGKVSVDGEVVSDAAYHVRLKSEFTIEVDGVARVTVQVGGRRRDANGKDQ